MTLSLSEVQENTVKALLGQRGVAAIPGEKLTVFGGETVRVTAVVEYRGPAIQDRLYAAIGERGIVFDEIWANLGPLVNFAESSDWVSYTLTTDIVTDTAHPHADYDLMAKLAYRPHIFQELYDCIDVVGVAEFRNFGITSYEKV